MAQRHFDREGHLLKGIAAHGQGSEHISMPVRAAQAAKRASGLLMAAKVHGPAGRRKRVKHLRGGGVRISFA